MPQPGPSPLDQLAQRDRQGDRAELEDRHPGDIPALEDPHGDGIRLVEPRAGPQQGEGHEQVGDAQHEQDEAQPLQVAGLAREVAEVLAPGRGLVARGPARARRRRGRRRRPGRCRLGGRQLGQGVSARARGVRGCGPIRARCPGRLDGLGDRLHVPAGPAAHPAPASSLGVSYDRPQRAHQNRVVMAASPDGSPIVAARSRPAPTARRSRPRPAARRRRRAGRPGRASLARRQPGPACPRPRYRATIRPAASARRSLNIDGIRASRVFMPLVARQQHPLGLGHTSPVRPG